MKIYRTKDGGEYPEYTKFARYHAPCGIDWVPLQISEKHVKSFDLSQLREVVDPRLTDMVYTCAEPPVDQHWADVQQARIEWNWKHVYIDADMLGKWKPGKKGVAGAEAEMSVGVRLCPLWKPTTIVSLYAESMRAA